MAEVSPTYNSIFSEEYWGEIYDLPEPVLAVPPVGVYNQMRKLTASAAEAIFRGSERTRLPAGASIDPADESSELTPGTIALLDVEQLSIGDVDTSGVEVVKDFQKPFYKQKFITNEGHLMAPASSLFMMNSVRLPFGKELTVYPYTKAVPGPGEDAKYSRSIRLAACGVDREGKPIVKMMPMWEPIEGGSVRGYCKLRDAVNVRFQPLEVGQSFINEASNLVIRLRAAEVCLRGSIEYAKARKKVKRGAFAGRLALGRIPAS